MPHSLGPRQELKGLVALHQPHSWGVTDLTVVSTLVRHPFCVSFSQIFHSMSSAVEGSFNLDSRLQPRKSGRHQLRRTATASCYVRWEQQGKEKPFAFLTVTLKNLAQAAVGAGERKHYLTPVSGQISLFLCQQRWFVVVDICHAGQLSFMMSNKLLHSITVCNLREWPLWQMVALESRRCWRNSAVSTKPCETQKEAHSTAGTITPCFSTSRQLVGLGSSEQTIKEASSLRSWCSTGKCYLKVMVSYCFRGFQD